MSDFFAMGGYAAYVWSAWGISAAAVAGLIVMVFMERGAVRERLRRLEEDEA